MATIKEIAKACGYSPSTISYALRDNPRIPEGTREIIKKKAKQLGYQRDAHLGQLMAHLKNKRRHNQVCPIAWINSSANPNHWRETPWAREFYESAKERAKEQGFTINEIWAHDQKVPHTKLDEVLKARGTQGIILSTPLQDQEWLHWIDWNAYATVIIDEPHALPQFDHIYALYSTNMRMALEQAFARGYKRPKVWLSDSDDYWTAYGYSSECLRHSHIAPNSEPILTQAKPDMNEKSIREWIDEHNPDIVIAPTTTLGNKLLKMGYKIPEDFGYLAMYVLNEDLRWSGISQLHMEQSKIAIDRLASLLQMNNKGSQAHPLHIQIKGEWHEGTTLRGQEYEPERSDR